MQEKDTISDTRFANMLVDSSLDAIIAIDMQGNITAWNKAAEVAYGNTKATALGKPLPDMIAGLKDDPEALHALELAQQGFKSFVPANKDIEYRSHSETHYTPLTDEEDVQVGVMQIIHDVSHRIKAERHLEKLNEALHLKNLQLQRAMSEMATFTLISSNNIKQPIRLLYTDVEFLIRVEASRLTDTGKATFRRVQLSLNKMNLLLDDMQQLAEIGIAQPSECINLDEIIAAAKQKMEKKILEANAEIKIETLCTIKGDRALLEKLFYQLLDNAVKFNHSNPPQVTVACEEVTYRPEENIKPGLYYKIAVTDNGIGIEEKDRERIFTLFEKVEQPRKYRGTGLGLTMARKIMYAHNGYIEAAPAPGGKGTVFNCYFPIEAALPEEIQEED